ncbi:cell wall endopeptidase, family M23/M37 [Niallia nealsonii AAU1]|nr:cell wall endopeptidase, family M23/M37 [Niallia nealsonii AAU1]
MSDNKNTQETLNEKLVNGMKGLGRLLSKPFSKKLKQKAAAVAKKAIKVAAKVILKVLKQIFAWLIGTVGIPGILITLGIIIVTVIISVALSFFWTSDDNLSGDDAKIQAYIKEQSESTVNMDSDLERPYRVPEGLISSTIMLDFLSKKITVFPKRKKLLETWLLNSLLNLSMVNMMNGKKSK